VVVVDLLNACNENGAKGDSARGQIRGWPSLVSLVEGGEGDGRKRKVIEYEDAQKEENDEVERKNKSKSKKDKKKEKREEDKKKELKKGNSPWCSSAREGSPC